MPNVAFGSPEEEKRQASDRPQRGRGRPAGCREAFEGGARGCLTSPLEAHRKSFRHASSLTLPSEAQKKRRGRLRTGHREAGAGLPAAEKRLRAGPVGV